MSAKRTPRTPKPSKRATRNVAMPDPDRHPEPDPGTLPPDTRSVLTLLRDVHEGRLSGQMLAKPDRIRIVEHMTAEGYGASEIAEVLKVTERTVTRDRADARAMNALTVTPGFVLETVGQLAATADQVKRRLRRIGRDTSAKPADRIAAEMGVWQVERELVTTLQGLGYLPTAATEINARISGDAHLPATSELLAELDRLRALPDIVASDGTPVVPGRLDELRLALVRASAAEQIESMTHRGGQPRARHADAGRTEP
jgi:transposase